MAGSNIKKMQLPIPNMMYVLIQKSDYVTQENKQFHFINFWINSESANFTKFSQFTSLIAFLNLSRDHAL